MIRGRGPARPWPACGRRRLALAGGVRGHRRVGEDVPPRTDEIERTKPISSVHERETKLLPHVDFRRVSKAGTALDNVASIAKRGQVVGADFMCLGTDRILRRRTFAERKSTLMGLALHRLSVISRTDGGWLGESRLPGTHVRGGRSAQELVARAFGRAGPGKMIGKSSLSTGTGIAHFGGLSPVITEFLTLRLTCYRFYSFNLRDQ